MKKKIVAMCATVALAALAVGGTLAYFTDTDEAKNTFELGGVDITLTEKAYEDGQWKDIENQDGVTELGQLDPVNTESWAAVSTAGYAYNKGVFTINNEDAAYIRNYVAIESIGDQTVNGENEGDIYHIWYNNAAVSNPSEGGDLRHGASVTQVFEDVVIGETKYDIYVFDTLDNAAVETGDSFMTLTTVALHEWVTNEMVEQLGDKFEVYTFSEAIQESGLSFDEAMKALIGDDGDLEAHATSLITGLISA